MRGFCHPTMTSTSRATRTRFARRRNGAATARLASAHDPQPARTPSFALVVLATCMAFLLVQLDVTIVNVALATMGEALHAALSGLQWVVDAYAIAFASLLLSAGALGDRMGPRRIPPWASRCSSRPRSAAVSRRTAALLIAARVAQGVGAALMVPASLALLNHALGGDARLRGHAVAWWTAAGVVAWRRGRCRRPADVRSVGAASSSSTCPCAWPASGSRATCRRRPPAATVRRWTSQASCSPRCCWPR